jgi:hypothetical protein
MRMHAVKVASRSINVESHPALYEAVTGQPGDVALGAAVADALRQVRPRLCTIQAVFVKITDFSQLQPLLHLFVLLEHALRCD